jgi:hypothetical protein
VCGTFLVRSAAALAGDFALLFGRHRSKSPAFLSLSAGRHCCASVKWSVRPGHVGSLRSRFRRWVLNAPGGAARRAASPAPSTGIRIWLLWLVVGAVGTLPGTHGPRRYQRPCLRPGLAGALKCCIFRLLPMGP